MESRGKESENVVQIRRKERQTDLPRAPKPIRNGFHQHLRPGIEDGERCRQSCTKSPPRYIPHEYRGEEPGGGDSQSREAIEAFPCVWQRSRHTGERSYRLETDRCRFEIDRL